MLLTYQFARFAIPPIGLLYQRGQLSRHNILFGPNATKGSFKNIGTQWEKCVGIPRGKERIRVVISGTIPPPVGGQNINIARVLRLLGECKDIEPVYWEWGFTRDWTAHKSYSFSKILELFRVALRLFRIRLAGRIDFLLYSTSGPETIPMLRDILLLPLARLLARRVTIYFQAAGIARRQHAMNPIMMALYRAAHLGCWGGIVITDYGRVDPESLGIKNNVVLPYGIEDHANSANLANHLVSSDHIPVILNVGHMCPNKGTPQLIAACGELRKAGYSFNLVLVGECLPPYSKDELSDDLSEAKIEDITQCCGLLQGAALWQQYRKADLFVFSSVAPYESFGLALLEAMMMGLPVVVTDWRANADVLGRSQPAGGVITSSNEFEPLRERLRAAIANALEQREQWPLWGSRNRRRYLEEFSVEAFRLRLQAYFTQETS